MARKRNIRLEFPVGGVSKRRGIQHQAPFTTPRATNVRTQDPIEGRDQGGVRPGVKKKFQNTYPFPIRLLDTVSYVPGESVSQGAFSNTTIENFNSSAADNGWEDWNYYQPHLPGTDWSEILEFLGRDGLPRYRGSGGSLPMDNYVSAKWSPRLSDPPPTWKMSVGQVNRAIFGGESILNSTLDMKWTIGYAYDSPEYGGPVYPGNSFYSFYWGISGGDAFSQETDVVPKPADEFPGRAPYETDSGFVLEVNVVNFLGDRPSEVIVFLVPMKSGSGFNPAVLGQQFVVADPRVLEIHIIANHEDDIFSLYVKDVNSDVLHTVSENAPLLLDSGNLGGDLMGYGLRISPRTTFGGLNSGDGGAELRLGKFELVHSGPQSQVTQLEGEPIKAIVSATNRPEPTDFTSISPGDGEFLRFPLHPDNPLQNLQPQLRNNLLKITNNNLSDFFVAGPSIASVEFNQRIYIVNPHSYGDVSDESDVGRVLMYNPLTDTLDFAPGSLTAVPDDPANPDLDETPPIPQWNNSIAVFLGRLYLAGDREAPQLWYASRQGVPDDQPIPDGLDFDFFGGLGSDPQQAVAGLTSEAGTIGEPIVSMVPVSEDYMIFSGTNTLWVLRGDPRQGGRFDALSKDVSFLSRDSWCLSPNMTLFFLSSRGLYAIPPGASGYPQPISPRKIPRELIQETTGSRAILTFDSARNGVNIFVRNNVDVPISWWWYDVLNDAFWPQHVGARTVVSDPYEQLFSPSVTASTRKAPEFLSGGSSNLMGFGQGDWGFFEDGIRNDLGQGVFDSSVTYGPIRIGRTDHHDGVIHSMRAKLTDLSPSIKWSLLIGETATAALSSNPVVTGVWNPGRNYPNMVRARGHMAYLQIDDLDSSAGAWTIEELDMTIMDAGIQRHTRNSGTPPVPGPTKPRRTSLP